MRDDESPLTASVDAAAAQLPEEAPTPSPTATKAANEKDDTAEGRTGRGRAREGADQEPASTGKAGKKNAKEGDGAAAAGGGKDGKPSMFQRVRERSIIEERLYS